MHDRRINLHRPSVIILTVYLAFFTVQIIRSESRDIRPSEHGLPYQKTPKVESPAVASFFSGASDVALPEARNYSDPYWGIIGGVTPGNYSHVDGHGHVSEVLLVISLVCGVAGLGLILASTLIYFFHIRKPK